MVRRGSKWQTPVCSATFGDVHPTRYPELNYQRQGNCWRIIDAETNAPVGSQYHTKTELLADLERFATVFGSN